MLFALHIGDPFLHPVWLCGGLLLAAALAAAGSWRLKDEEVPRIALVTACLFIASSVHIKVGPTSAHLLLNGLAGILLGWRAALAIPVALLLQAVLLSHGGLLALGVNACIMVLPALAAGALFRGMNRVAWARHPWFRSALVACSVLVWIASLVSSLGLLGSTFTLEGNAYHLEAIPALWFSPWVWAGALVVAGSLTFIGRRMETAPEFPFGVFLGVLTVLFSLALNLFVLRESYFPVAPEALVLIHLPIAAVEGIILGFLVGFLARVRPDLLGIQSAPMRKEAGSC